MALSSKTQLASRFVLTLSMGWALLGAASNATWAQVEFSPETLRVIVPIGARAAAPKPWPRITGTGFQAESPFAAIRTFVLPSTIPGGETASKVPLITWFRERAPPGLESTFRVAGELSPNQRITGYLWPDVAEWVTAANVARSARQCAPDGDTCASERVRDPLFFLNSNAATYSHLTGHCLQRAPGPGRKDMITVRRATSVRREGERGVAWTRYPLSRALTTSWA